MKFILTPDRTRTAIHYISVDRERIGKLLLGKVFWKLAIKQINFLKEKRAAGNARRAGVTKRNIGDCDTSGGIPPPAGKSQSKMLLTLSVCAF
jgi:hypothetical protein